MANKKKKTVQAKKTVNKKVAPKVKTKVQIKAKAKVKAKPKAGVKAKAVAKPLAKSKIKAKPKTKSAKKPNSKAKVKVAVKSAAKTKTSSKPKIEAKLKSAPKNSQTNLKALSEFFSPLEDRILVLPKAEETKTAGGLFIPDVAKEKQYQAQVLAVGQGRRTKKGNLKPLDVQKGDEVLYSQYAGSEIEILGQKLLIMKEDEVLGILSK